MSGGPISIVFTTRNRRELLATALRAARAQTVPTRLIVADDASDDGTAEMLRAEFPEVTHLRSGTCRGPSYQRNRGVEAADSDVVVLLDDDSVLQSARTVEQTVGEFDDQRVGAVAVPFVNVARDTVVRTRAPDDRRVYVGHAFVAAAHAVRRDAFLAVGGYREHLFYYGEEGDLSLRLLAAGRVVRFGSADPVHHHQPPARVSRAADWYGRRNDVLVPALTAPLRALPAVLAGTTLNGLRYGVKCGRPFRMARGLLSGYCAAVARIGERKPVSAATYRLFRRLKQFEPVPLGDIASELEGRRQPGGGVL